MMKIVQIGVLFTLLIGCALEAKPLFRIGMHRANVQKAFPQYSQAFKTTGASVRINDYSFYGMKGDILFMFQSDTLVLFLWQYAPKVSTLSSVEIIQYGKLVRKLEGDYGKPAKTDISEFDSRIEQYYWRFTDSSGHTAYKGGHLKFVIASNTYIEGMRPKN